MPIARMDRPPLRLSPGALLVPALIAIIALSTAVSSAGSTPATSKRVVEEAQSSALGRTVLTNRRGLTLYSLSAERRGRFICEGACLHLWRPLIVADGVRPTGPVRLGTIRRPNGRRQVTFAGRPLYRFSGDVKPGEANGEGFRDVGTWHAASPAQPQPSPAPAPPSPAPYPNPY